MFRFVLILISVFYVLPLTRAQGIFEDALSDPESEDITPEAFSLNGYARGSVYFVGDEFDYSGLFGEFALQGRLSGEGVFLYGDVRFRDGLFFDQRKSRVEVKEAYTGIRWDNADIFLGNQIIRWGRTDGFNPVDNINPRDYFFMTPDPDDQLIGNFMLRTRFRPFNNSELEIIAIPFYKPSVYRYEYFEMGEEADFAEGILPDAAFGNSSVAARFDVELPAIGFAFSYFRGYDPFYGFDIKSVSLIPEPEIIFMPDYYKKNAAGFDMAMAADPWIVRFESVYNITTDYRDNMHIPNPEIYYVGGLERRIGNVNAIFQYIGKYVMKFDPVEQPVLQDPLDPEDLYRYALETVSYEAAMYNRRIFLQQEEFNHALFVSLSRSFLYEEIRTEFSAYYNITSEEYFIRPELTWNARDGMQISAGAYFMKGPDDSIYDMAGRVLGGFFTGIRMAF